jgi:hypothetical protein
MNLKKSLMICFTWIAQIMTKRHHNIMTIILHMHIWMSISVIKLFKFLLNFGRLKKGGCGLIFTCSKQFKV